MYLFSLSYYEAEVLTLLISLRLSIKLSSSVGLIDGFMF